MCILGMKVLIPFDKKSLYTIYIIRKSVAVGRLGFRITIGNMEFAGLWLQLITSVC